MAAVSSSIPAARAPTSVSLAVAEMRHGNVTKKIAVYENMAPAELDLLVHASFFPNKTAPEWDRKVVGFVHPKTKTFIPLGIGTAFPTLFQPNHTYEIVLEKPAAGTTPSPPATQTQSTKSKPAPEPKVSRGPKSPPTRNATPVPTDTRPWTDKLFAILADFSASSPGSPAALTPDQLNRLELLLGQGHSALHQAYLAYEENHELDSLHGAVHRVLAVVLQQQKSSFTRVINSLTLLKPHDIALVHELYTQGNELVLAAWEVYELDEDRFELADTLLRIVRFKSQASAPANHQSPPPSALAMEDVLREMCQRQLISAAQLAGLDKLWRAKNEAMVGAMEAYVVDHDLKELVETLLLVVKHAGLTTTHKPAPIVVPATALEELHPLSPKATAQSPPSYGTFAEGSALSSPRAVASSSVAATSSVAASSAVVSPAKSPKKTLRVATSLPVTAMPLFSPSHYAPDSDEFYIVRVLEELVTAGQLSAGQLMALKTLLKKRDTVLFTAVGGYRKDGDRDALVAALVDRCDVLNWEANHQSILHTWIVPLEQAGRGNGLRDLWLNNDPRMMAAYQLFLHDQNRADFEDTLARLSAVASEAATEAAADVITDAADEAVAAEAIEELERAGRLGQEVAEQLSAEDPRVLAALDVFSDSQDVPELVDTLERIASPRVAVEADDVSAPAMEKQILHLVYELELPSDELLALKGAIVDNDVVVQAAIQVFEAEKDEEDFKDTLRRVARHLVSATEAVPAP
ncbi:hypothetical protein ACHHYP_07678 [Achlya hypogyna]|uniref:Uncharacterized protein n=1 Tax=Achlya hypogyna TaxID=1202772 RepID=A0A1V9YQW2_ACHHY|nr:hypothetical protein ACHHYP_07678 [Achlya hypogyna]